MRFNDLIPSSQNLSYGLFLGVDFENNPQSLVRLMSRKKLSEDEAQRLIREKTKLYNDVILGF